MFIKKIKVVLGLTAVLGIVSICGCSQDSEDKNALNTALSNLENLDKSYVINNIMESPGNTLAYLETVCSEGVYTQYVVSNAQADEEMSNNNTGVYLTDWLTNDNQYYQFSDSGDGSTPKVVKLPKGYGELCANKKYMYLDKIIPNLTDIKNKGEQSIDTGYGETGKETFTMYQGKVDSKTIKEILGISSYGLYKAARDEAGKDDPNIYKLCDYYLSDINDTLSCSDAKVLIGVSDNIIKYLRISVGGLGSRLYLTKYISFDEVQVSEHPSFENATEFKETLRELADFLADADDYEEAIQNMNQNAVSDSALSVDGTLDENAISEDNTEQSLNEDKASKDNKTSGDNKVPDKDNESEDAEDNK